MTIVRFDFFSWKAPKVSEDSLLEIIALCKSIGLKNTANNLIPIDKALVVSLILFFLIGPIFCLIFGDNPREELTRSFAYAAAVFSGWAIIQLLIYLASIYIARRKCQLWLKSLLKYGPKPITCEFSFGNKTISKKFNNTQLNEYLNEGEKFTAVLENSKRWELWVRLILLVIQHPEKNEISINQALACLACLIKPEPQLSELYKIELGLDGYCVGKLILDDEIKKSINFGRLTIAK
jgi:hypothetical protein